MAKKVTWSPLAKEALKERLLSSQERHQSKQYSKMMFQLLEGALHRVSLNPFIGQPTETENIRYITPHPDYTLFYRHSLLQIEVLVLWNNHYKMGRINAQKPEES